MVRIKLACRRPGWKRVYIYRSSSPARCVSRLRFICSLCKVILCILKWCARAFISRLKRDAPFPIFRPVTRACILNAVTCDKTAYIYVRQRDIALLSIGEHRGDTLIVPLPRDNAGSFKADGGIKISKNSDASSRISLLLLFFFFFFFFFL